MSHSGSVAPVDAIIVNWNGRRFLERCIAALQNQTAPVRITVIDNASADGSADYIRVAHPRITLIEHVSNEGYAAGANTGLRHAAGKYAMILNPDVALAPDHIEVLASRLDADPTIGAAQGKLWQVGAADFHAGKLVRGGCLDSAGHAIRRTRMVVDRGQGLPDEPRFSRDEPVFSACGAALFLRRTMLADVAPEGNYFDESFFAYKEDIDLCWRARLLGWDVRYVPDAVAWHVRGWGGYRPSPATQSLEARLHSFKNHYLLLLKNDRLPDILRDLPAILAWEALRLGHACIRDPALLRSYRELAKLIRPVLAKRHAIMQRRRAPPHEIHRWFRNDGRPRV